MEDLLLGLIGGIGGGALQSWLWTEWKRWRRKPEDRNAGLFRYQDWKGRK